MKSLNLGLGTTIGTVICPVYMSANMYIWVYITQVIIKITMEQEELLKKNPVDNIFVKEERYLLNITR